MRYEAMVWAFGRLGRRLALAGVIWRRAAFGRRLGWLYSLAFGCVWLRIGCIVIV